MLGLGQTIRTVVQDVALQNRTGLVAFKDDNTWFPVDPIWLLYNDLNPKDQEEQLKHIRDGIAAILVGAATYEAWRDVPTDYVRMSEDRWLPPEFQIYCLRNAERAGVPVNISVLHSGHSPYINHAVALAELAVKVHNTSA